AQELANAGERERLAGLLLLAPAPDFTSDLIEPNLTEAERTQLAEKGWFEEPSQYSDEGNVFTQAFLDDGRANRVLGAPLDPGCPVRILQGMADPDVPHGHALKLMDHLALADTTLTLVRDGDHRLSRPQDLALLQRTLRQMLDDSVAK
ncbi:MAG TPA: alpha/beta hydrolase, partial [Rhizobiaceae bacterium]|nr:alpha/beta hydrolase [Rhizobiaceae bacterium]